MEQQPAMPPIETPLTVQVIDGGVILDGDDQVDVALTPEAAIETGIRLINAGMSIDEGMAGSQDNGAAATAP